MPSNLYRLKFDLESCVADVRVNDFPLYHRPEGGGVHTQIPLNLYLRPGPNVVSRSVTPLPGDTAVLAEAQCDLEILVRDHEQPPESRVPMTRMEPVSPAIPYSELPFEAAVSFPEPLWFHSAVLDASPALRDAMLSRQRLLHSLLERSEFDLLMSIMRPKVAEIAAAIYRPLAEMEAETLRDLERFRRMFPGPLEPFDDTHAVVRLSAYGRLASLVDARNGKSLIRSPREETGLTGSLRVFFCFSDGDLLWIR